MLKYALLRMAVDFCFSGKQCKSVPDPHKWQVKHIQQNATSCFIKDLKGNDWSKEEQSQHLPS